MKPKINSNLRPYLTVANGIAKTFGSNCEVVLHDLSHPRTSVVFVKNGHVTGRKIGDGIRDLVLDVLLSPNFNEDALTNYQSSIVKGKIIKATTIVIRSAKKEVIGALCINIDITNMKLAIKEIDDITKINNPLNAKRADIKIHNSSVIDILDSIICQTIQESGKLPENMKKNDFIKIIKFLDEKGIFLIKNSVDWVAKKLDLSKFTIYGYLKEIRVDEEIQNR